MPGKAMLREGRIRLSLRFDVDRQRRRKLHELFVGRYGLRVRGGPFAGLGYPRQAPKWGYNLVPRLLGTYECELHHVFEQVIATGFPTIIDVGAADGYYTVGLALKSPGSTVHAFAPV